MKFRTALFFTGWVSVAPVWAAADQAAVPAGSPTEKDLAQWVKELSDDQYRTRENATLEIWKQAKQAVPVLEEAAKSADPEQAFRARDLLQKIRLHITPDTDPAVIGLVEQYLKSTSIGEKSGLFEKMKPLRAWLQMLKLYEGEQDEDLKRKLQPSISGIAIRAAREKLNAGDLKSAEEFLELAPEDRRGLLALAELHRIQGTLPAELEKAKTLEGRKGKARYLALLRSAGDTRKASEIAAELGEDEITASMAALSGDPIPWLKIRTTSDPLVSAYHSAAINRWNHGKLRPQDLATLVDSLKSRAPDEQDAAMSALFLLGESDAVLPTYIKVDPMSAFIDLESQERIPEALKALGFDPDHPDYKPWVDKHFEQLTNQDIEDQHDVSSDDSELITLAGFLERRGQADTLFGLFSGPAAALAEKDSTTFLSLLGRLVGSGKSQDGAPILAKRLGVAWAGEDPLRWEELVSCFLGENEMGAEWWDWLEQMEPNTSRSLRLDALLALFDIGKDPENLRGSWLKKAWQNIESAPGKSADHVALIAGMATTCGDAATFLKAWDLLPQEKRNDQIWFQHIVCLTDDGRWDEAAAVILKQIESLTQARQDPGAAMHAYAAAALRKADREQEAAVHDAWVDKLTLGDAAMAIQVGNGYAFGCDYSRANEWWERAARLADPDSREFLQAISSCMDHLMESGRWDVAASTSEITCAIYASREYHLSKRFLMLRQRVQGDTARALATIKNQRDRSLAMLGKCHQLLLTDGSLADFFYPSLRRAGFMKEHDEWFEATWQAITGISRRYPESDNTHNTAAWLAARAMRHLDEAEKILAAAIKVRPRQPAYLDTMAELQFAKGNREKAIEWSKSAVNFSPVDDIEAEYLILRRQFERFQTEPLPKP